MFFGLKKFRPTLADTNTEPATNSDIYTSLNSLLHMRFHSTAFKTLDLRQVAAALAGDSASTRSGRGHEFDQVRAYQAGDDVRAIDWRVSAKTGKPHTKLFVEERQQSLFLIVDQRPSLFYGSRGKFKSVVAAELAAKVLWSALQGRQRSAGIVVGDSLQVCKGGQSRRSTVLFLNEIVTKNQSLKRLSHTSISSLELYQCAIKYAPKNALTIIISDFSGHEELQYSELAALNRNHPLLLISIRDAMESHFSATGSLGISNVDKQHTLYATTDVQQKLQNQQAQQFSALQKFSDRRQCTLLSVSSSAANNTMSPYHRAKRYD